VQLDIGERDDLCWLSVGRFGCIAHVLTVIAQ